MQANTYWLIILLLALLSSGIGAWLAWFRPALFRRIFIEPVALFYWWWPSEARWFRSKFYFWEMRLVSTVMFIVLLGALLFLPDLRTPAPPGEPVDTRFLAFMLATLALVTGGIVTSFNVARDCPPSRWWKAGIFTCNWLAGTLFIWGLMFPRGLPEFLIAGVLALPLGYLSITVILRKAQLAAVEADRKRRRIEEEYRIENEHRGLR